MQHVLARANFIFLASCQAIFLCQLCLHVPSQSAILCALALLVLTSSILWWCNASWLLLLELWKLSFASIYQQFRSDMCNVQSMEVHTPHPCARRLHRVRRHLKRMCQTLFFGQATAALCQHVMPWYLWGGVLGNMTACPKTTNPIPVTKAWWCSTQVCSCNMQVHDQTVWHQALCSRLAIICILMSRCICNARCCLLSGTKTNMSALLQTLLEPCLDSMYCLVRKAL